MSKYFPLQNFLIQLKDETKKISFSDIEKIIEFSLPKSARQYPAWWANQEHSVQSSSWLKAGWITHDIDLINETVIFTKSSFVTEIKKNTIKKIVKSQIHPTPYDWDTTQTINNNFKMKWLPFGKITLEQERLSFPNVDTIPALYRFRIRRKMGNEAVYIGETVNLRRRFGNYRNPGSSQKTSIRINETLIAALQENAEISVSIITEGSCIDIGNGWQTLDLSSKVARCFLENAAILNGCGIDIDSLNKAN